MTISVYLSEMEESGHSAPALLRLDSQSWHQVFLGTFLLSEKVKFPTVTWIGIALLNLWITDALQLSSLLTIYDTAYLCRASVFSGNSFIRLFQEPKPKSSLNTK